ncbi:hypothetical protein N9876_00805 [bacterium]|nr:hypothetical protein [bacterium]
MVEAFSKRRVLFVAMAAPGGIAGHHYSMRDLARAFTRHGWSAQVLLFSRMSDGISPPLAEFGPVFVKTGCGFGAAIRAMRRHVSEYATDLVLTFDEASNRVAICGLLGRLEILLPVKPGWVNSSSWSAASSEFVVFTAEDLLFYRSHPKFRKVHTNLISGRVEPPAVDLNASRKLRAKVLSRHDAQRLAICPVRIERGKSFFIDAVLSSFKLLCQNGDQDVALLIIGAEQDPSFLKELEIRTAKMPVSICTDPIYTDRLADVLSSGDVVYAIGRTTMEALLIGKKVFCPTGRSDQKLWEVTSKNFFVALAGNFTGRNRGKDLYATIKADTRDPPQASEIAELEELVYQNVSAEMSLPKYLAAYERSIEAPPSAIHQVRAFIFSRLRLLALDIHSRLMKNL